MFKFALFIVVALVAVQGFQARTVESDHQVRGLVDIINGFIKQIQDIVNSVGNIVGDLIDGLTNKIKEIINKIPEILNEIREKIEALIAQAGEIGRKCVDAHESEIQDIVATANNGMNACVDEAQSKVNDIKAQVNVLVEKIVAFQQNVSADVAKCVADANLNPIKLARCLRSLVGPIQDQIAEIEKEVANTVTVAKDTIAAATLGLANCVVKVQQDVATKQEALLNALKVCIEESINN